MDSIIPAAVLSAATLVNNVISSAKNARELAKQTGDSVLKDQIADLLDAVLDVKVRVLDLDEENRALKQQIAEKASIQRDKNTEGFYVKGEVDPLCPACYQGPRHLMTYLQDEGDGGMGWCVICRNRYVFARRSV